MKYVDTIARIRREFFVQGKTIKQIVRNLHVSRNTVREVVPSGRRFSSMSGSTSHAPDLIRGRMSSIGCWHRTRPKRPGNG